MIVDFITLWMKNFFRTLRISLSFPFLILLGLIIITSYFLSGRKRSFNDFDLYIDVWAEKNQGSRFGIPQSPAFSIIAGTALYLLIYAILL